MITGIGIPRKESRENKEKGKGSVGQCFMIILTKNILFVIVVWLGIFGKEVFPYLRKIKRKKKGLKWNINSIENNGTSHEKLKIRKGFCTKVIMQEYL